MFAERLGLETGWNCHISFSEKSAVFDEHSTLTGGSEGKVEDTGDEFGMSHRISGQSEHVQSETFEQGELDCSEDGNEKVDEQVLNEHVEIGGDQEMVEEEEEVEKRVKWDDTGEGK